ncbi:helix-turn-helix domain-containing protein [Pseudomonas entomophila]|uniref:helix-turn-helix domain-containing protein n=1 Tax=Pseudomonas entomophila TaxID=312306 RepID=UPI002158DA6B|nr:helix-turn-helix domain-containing protein [Pseudomonas entomophila]
MSTIIMTACWPLQSMSPAQKAVLISLADNANDDGVCWPSVSRIAQRTCLSERAVRTALRWLEQAKILTAHQRSGRSTWYTVSPSSYDPGSSCPQNRKGTIKEPSEEEKGIGDSAKVPVEKIIGLFNELLPTLPSVVLINKDRRSKLAARWADSPVHQDLEFWRDLFGMVESSDFLMGRIEGREKQFRCTFDWLIAPTNFVKVVEGNYHA